MQKRLFLLCVSVGISLYSIAQPANNNCGSAIPINTLDGTCVVNMDITNATEDMGPSACTAGANENVWFTFVADGVSAEIVVSNAIGTPEITIIQFPTSACNLGDAQEIDCSTGSPLIVDNALVEGTTYYVMVAFSNNADGFFDICIDNPEPANNDACTMAQPITSLDGTCGNFNNDFPSTDVLIPGCFTGSTYNVWFSFVAEGVSLDAYIPSGGPGTGQIAVVDFTGSVCNATGANVLGCATGTNHIILDNALDIGDTYYIVVGFQNSDFNGNGVGDFELCVDNPEPAVNDDCSGAIVIPGNVLDDPTTCFTSIAGNPLNNDWPSTDIFTFGCWNANESYNIWYSFVAQGPDVQVTVDPVFPQPAQIALVEFTGAPCVAAGGIVLDCENGNVLDFNDELIIGNTYYIALGFDNNAVGDFCMNVFNPEPPPNDDPCDAIALLTNNNCTDGTTVYANPENYAVPGACQSSLANTVWYTLTMSDPDNVGFEIDMDFDEVINHVSIILWQITDCNAPGPIIEFYCGAPPTEPLEFAPVDETVTYYLSIQTSEPNETDFEICVDEIPPCFTNDLCTEATVIDNVISDSPFVCINGCNLYADPETFNNGCSIGDFSTVWFQVPTDGNATLMNIQVQSQDFDAPTITLFHQITDCSDLVQIPLTQSDIPCVVGSNNEAEALATDVGSNEIYYIAVSSLNSDGGEFQLCVNTISVASACVASREIEITSRSSGGPLEGPFFPGETIGICMNVNSYTAAGNGCQWFQGIVPVFGNGWDPSSFDGDGQPLGATVNGNPIGAIGNGLYGGSTWDWFTDVGYHHNNVFFQITDLDGNGTVEMCNILYDPDCPNLGGIMGGCCGPCWDDPGDILPPGWFAYGINGTCGTPGPPVSVDWGDGNTCGAGMGPWNFCFELTVREYPDCLEDASTMDLSLGFFTFADGEVGSWTGGASVCALDQPAKITLPMCCSELETAAEEVDPICSDQQFVYTIDQPDVDFWQWTVSSGPVTGAFDGQGGPGTTIIHTLVNTTEEPEIVTYTFLGFAGGACPVFEHEVTVEVFPQIQVTLDPLILCATPTTPYTLTPTVTGGTGDYEYVWIPNGEMTPSITISNPVNGTQYKVSVNDEIGCFGGAAMTITVYTTFPVDILAPVVEQCLVDGPIELSATATGDFPPFTFTWTTPGGEVSGDQISSDMSGLHLVEVVDDEGCIGKDSVVLTLNESPEVSIEAVDGALAICEGESTLLSGVATMGETPYYYEWDTPDGPEDGKTIEAFSPGIFTVTVTDNNGCTNTSDIEILPQEQPNPTITPDVTVCNFDDPVEISVEEEFEDYQWSVGAIADGLPSIEVYQAGTYSVTVTNDVGCTGESEMEISVYDPPVFPIPDTFEMCSGSTLTIDADEYGGPWDIVLWVPSNGGFNPIDITGEGVFDVTVYDENGCTAQAEIEVLETASLSPGLTGPDVICSGNSITLTADVGFDSYIWSPNAGGDTDNSINVTAPGTYIVTVADALGCAGVDSIEVESGDITVTISGPTAICAGVQATLDAGPGYQSYLWSDTSPTQMIQVEEGSYSVTVTSSDGCTATASTTIVETPFVPVITGDNMICQTSETTTLDAGGPYASYQWSANAEGGATSQTVDVSLPGTYTVTVTDLSTCVGTASFVVSNHSVPFVAITGDPDFCVGGDTEMSATPGFVSYLWNTNAPTPDITVNTPGTYTVTITDVNGCTNTASSVVNNPYQETVEITGSFVFCPGDQATLEVPPGYTSIVWSTMQTGNPINVTTEGQVSVIVIDPDGCIAYDTVVTDENSTLSPKITGDSIICDGSSTVLNAGPGFGNYSWSDGLGSTQTVTVNSPGIYAVTVSSLSGCTGTDSIEVTENLTPTANVTSTASACSTQEPGGPTTIINFDDLVTGGDQGGSWLQVSGPSSVNLLNTASVNFNGLQIGTYNFTYTTNSALDPCEESTYPLVVTINDCSCPVVDIGSGPDLCNDLGTIDLSTLLIAPTQDNGTWQIISDPGGTNPAIITGMDFFDATNADKGLYTIQYTMGGLPTYCPNTVTTTINVLKTPVAGSAAAPATYCAGESQTVNLSSLLIGADQGGKWFESSVTPSTGGAFNDATGTFNIVSQLPGSYTFEYVIEGEDPCPDDQVTVQVIIENNPVADAGSTVVLDCNSSSTILGGPGTSMGDEFTYSWTTTDGTLMNSSQLNATATKKGTYVLTVLNVETGCSATDEVFIDQIGDFPSAVDMLVQSPDCEGDPPGSMQVNAVTGGIAPFTYSLNGAAPVTSGVFNNLAAGDYELLVTDATGCKLRDSFTIEELVILDLSIVNYVNDTFIFAFGDTFQLSYLFSGSSDIPDSLVWKLGDSVVCVNCALLEMVANLAGKITLEAYDTRGCFISESLFFQVVRSRDVYIPNVFSPNDDGVNDKFTLYTDSDVKEITKMEVFTRWGDLIFRKENFPPNDPDQGWDGKFRGENLNPGVYVYRLEILYGDDLKENLAGDITVIR